MLLHACFCFLSPSRLRSPLPPCRPPALGTGALALGLFPFVEFLAVTGTAVAVADAQDTLAGATVLMLAGAAFP